MNMGGADNKRIREDEELSPPEDSCRQKQACLMEFEAGMAFDKPENSGAGSENLPEFCLLSNEYSMLLKDPGSWEHSASFGIRNIVAIRKQSYLLDYPQDSAVDNSREKEVAVQQKLQVEEDCLERFIFEATDYQLWTPESPLRNKEPLFSLDSIGSHDCTILLRDESVGQSATSWFRVWEQDDDHNDEKNHADGISFV